MKGGKLVERADPCVGCMGQLKIERDEVGPGAGDLGGSPERLTRCSIMLLESKQRSKEACTVKETMAAWL